MFVPYREMTTGTLGNLVMDSFVGAVSFEQIEDAHKKGGVEVKMTVDGREVDVEAFLKRWEEVLLDNVRKNVLGDIEDKVSNINRALSKIQEVAKEVLEVKEQEYD